jgi:tetratricopeptide (TPR) repeat protein
MPNAEQRPQRPITSMPSMSRALPRKERLEELLALAQTYRGWTLRELADSLGRDPHKLVPESGVPKLDLVMRLAEVLDWSVDHVAKDLCDQTDTPVEAATAPAAVDFSALDRAAFEAYERSDFEAVERIANEAFSVASNANERARALMRQCVAADARGLYTQALEAAQRGLREVEASFEFHLSFRANLANAHYTLGNLYEAEALANSLVGWFANNPMPSPLSQSTKAFAFYVRGSCHRCFAGLALPTKLWHAQRAREDLLQAERLLDEYAVQTKLETYAGYANVCRGAAMEVAPMLGVAAPDQVLEKLLTGLDQVVTPEQMPRGAWLESWGWWCIFGCNVALRHVDDPERLQSLMAIFTNKADEIAEYLGNWALRERVWTLELERRRRAEGAESTEDWVMDSDDVRVVAGTMARFPVFREVGWQVLRSARRLGQ